MNSLAALALKHWKALAVLVPLVLALAWQTFQVTRWKGREAEARATIVKLEAASREARAKQIALNTANHELSQRIAANATLRHVQTSIAVDRAVSAYAGTHRLQDRCSSSRSGSAAVPGDPEAPDRPDADAILAVPRSDFESLAKDALRGAEARAFLIDLINEGLAVESHEPTSN